MFKIIFLSPVHPLLTPGDPLPRWQMQGSWVRALQKAGNDVKVVRYTPENGRKLNLLERILQNIRVIRVIRAIRGIDLIIFSLGADVLLPLTLKLIKWLTGAPLVILSGVSPVSDGNPREREMAKFVDLAATNDPQHAEEWLKLGAKEAVVLPISGMDPELYINKGRAFRLAKGLALKDIDVLFVGTLTKERKKFFGELRRLLPETVNFVIKEFIWEEEYARVMSRSKIVLNPIRPEMKNGANLRMFEIPAFGALELASFGKKEWLTPGKEMLVYKDVKEAAELIIRYLKDDRARERMAEAGYRRVMKEHTFDERAKKLMSFVLGCLVDENLLIRRHPLAPLGASPPRLTAGRVASDGSSLTRKFANFDSFLSTKRVDVSVCIVNYKADEELKRCLASIKKFTKGISFEIIVIDNSKDNRWYSGGNNQTLAKSKGKYVLFLNPDCYLTGNVLGKIVGWMDRHLEVGAVEPRQIYETGETAPTGSLLPRWWVDAVELTILNRWAPKYASFISWSSSTQPKSATSGFGRTGDFFLRKKPGPSEEIDGVLSGMMKYRQVDKNRMENWRTEVVSGAAMMVRKSVLDEIGGFDERLKLYYTDVDLCRRILKTGFEVWHLGKFSLGHSTRKSTSKLKWDELYDIYAQDARSYYRKWGGEIGGAILFLTMNLNKLIVKLGKRFGRLGK